MKQKGEKVMWSDESGFSMFQSGSAVGEEERWMK